MAFFAPNPTFTPLKPLPLLLWRCFALFFKVYGLFRVVYGLFWIVTVLFRHCCGVDYGLTVD